ncbi:tumor necrosis factor receptor superfamily member 19L isoform X2 [Clupea harengus]|uniref:Tumor necrosis factor receptor superfamily member 19L isoform X2 n=1 Tax=Clupea harengus TaxID=7950 RepID=A0A6P8FSN6_CLUHA|nr:tumor necrosis factor receptor superfamily member 19L isoform X2 [Clupea harengus]
MMRNHLCCSAPFLLFLLGLWGALAAQCGEGEGEGCVCQQCPAGEEPTKACVEVEGPVVVGCQACPAGTFSNTHNANQCRPHSSCWFLHRKVVALGTSATDTVCGGCLPGFHPAAAQRASTLYACARKVAERLVRVPRTVGKSSTRGSGMAAANATNVRGPEEKTTEYAVFALVPIFCIMGLLGILICNLLKKKGYRCTADKEGGNEETATPQKESNACPYIVDDPNEDTISVLVRLITEKKENAAALEELLLEYESKQMAVNKASSIKFAGLPNLAQFHSLPQMCPHQHLHTINGLAPRSGTCCSRCSQKKWPELLLPPHIDTHKTSSPPASTPLPRECTILSVGRFQVAQIPEQKGVSVETTPVESSDTDSVDTSHTGPADKKSLLGLSSASALSRSRQEVHV